MAYPFYQNPYQQYFPATYQPPVQPQTATTTQSGIIWVSGAQEAAMYPIAPNNAVALWDRGGSVIYLKQADATGKPSMTIYDLVERKENSAADKPEPAEEYAKKTDLVAVAGTVKSVNEIIASIRADIDALKGDMYGIAGKKRPVKKPESVGVSDDDE